ncbi:CRISPR-associated protein Cas6 [Vulcanisaeta moutnovskia 768-28]|uniref:CRISPR-associated protein Cas6 n=1 Tax=Vulcanisaeta moutnovskia (strain 768-28) TaxID=985053 RepID=F0QSS8_VULM7|nr:CRISPR system precrRNA processing endoribonuclease RAMP protein Cas6 [Vulcanisaeta moutnovskia]ADY01595.1 CRISPR-associated protein Cas6 [Vulcanisaeta moutnovskia 768-28]
MIVSLIIYFSIEHPIRFRTWNGRFVNRVINETLESINVKVQHGAREKPFTSTPILDLKNAVVNVLSPGNHYWFRVSLFCNEVDCPGAIEAFTSPMFQLSTGEVLNIIKINLNNSELISKDHGENEDIRAVIHWRVRFWPTSFIFRSQYVTWPSPARFFSSAALTLVRVLRGSNALISKGGEPLIGIINDADFKGFVKDLVFNTEVLSMRVRRLMINLGRGRRLPAFNGVAEYVTYTDRPGLFRLLLDVANAYGVGKNRALGLGYVNVDVLGQHLLR